MQPNYYLRQVGALALIACLITIEFGGALANKDREEAPKPKKSAHIRRLITKKSSSPPPTPDFGPARAIQRPRGPPKIKMSNGGSSNQVDVNPNISITAPPAPIEATRADQDEPDQAVYDEAPRVVKSVGAVVPVEQEAAEVQQSNNNDSMMGQLMANSANQVLEIGENNGNSAKRVLRNSGQVNETIIEGVGNKKVTRIANVGNAQEQVIENVGNRASEQIASTGQVYQQAAQQVVSSTPMAVATGFPVTSGQSPLVQINMNNERVPVSLAAGPSASLLEPSLSQLLQAGIDSYNNNYRVVQNPTPFGNQLLSQVALNGHLQPHLQYQQPNHMVAASPFAQSTSLPMNTLPAVPFLGQAPQIVPLPATLANNPMLMMPSALSMQQRPFAMMLQPVVQPIIQPMMYPPVASYYGDGFGQWLQMMSAQAADKDQDKVELEKLESVEPEKEKEPAAQEEEEEKDEDEKVEKEPEEPKPEPKPEVEEVIEKKEKPVKYRMVKVPITEAEEALEAAATDSIETVETLVKKKDLPN